MDTRCSAKDLSNGKRKGDHLRILLNEPTDFIELTNGFEKYHFVHQALPEIDLAGIDLSITLLGKKLSAPIVISSMVGGIQSARRINSNLAEAAQKLGLAMGVGSQRCLIEDPETIETYRIRDIAPDILLFANLGAVQLNYGFGVEQCLKAVRSIEADALILHLNPLQEALQLEGNTRFSGLLIKIKSICSALPVPVIIKEVGMGISEEIAKKISETGAACIDVAGAGGTCWSEIERMRATNKISNNIAQAFSCWGIPTADSLVMAKKGAPGMTIFASGGIRNGIDAAKAIALGADVVGIASPLLKAADVSSQNVEEYLQEIIETMRIAMFCISTDSIDKLKNSTFLRRE